MRRFMSASFAELGERSGGSSVNAGSLGSAAGVEFFTATVESDSDSFKCRLGSGYLSCCLLSGIDFHGARNEVLAAGRCAEAFRGKGQSICKLVDVLRFDFSGSYVTSRPPQFLAHRHPLLL